MEIMVSGRKLFGHTENTKIRVDLEEVCCVFQVLCNFKLLVSPWVSTCSPAADVLLETKEKRYWRDG